jgi:hypothetical protein
MADALDEPVDSGMSGDAVERAEWAWANLPVGPRKWTSLTTAEKALACHTFAALSASEAQIRADERWRAYEAARGTNADLCKTAGGAYRLMLDAIRSLSPVEERG